MANRIFISTQENLESPPWLEKANAFVLTAMEKLGFDGEEISILFCNNRYIQELNKCYRSVDSPTDVLSFEDGSVYEEDGVKWKSAGDIAVSIEMIAENAAYFKTTENAELKRLLVHGILHLNGMDHGDEHIEEGREPECEMLVLQEKILKELAAEIIL